MWKVIGIVAGLAVTLPINAQFYNQTNLVSDIPQTAQFTDPNLVNPWGVSHSATSPFWVSNAGKGVATLYSVNPTTGAVTKSSLTVTVPQPAGQVSNGSGDFPVTLGGATGPARFIFAGLDGKIYGWNPNVPAAGSTQAVEAATGTPPAAYTGIAVGVRASGQHVYGANPTGRIDVYNQNFTPVNLGAGAFADPNLPAGDTPFNISNIGGHLFVTYMGPVGVVNEFDTDGHFIRRFATGGTLSNPWGMAVAPATFGQFANALLIGSFNFGNAANGPGLISAFDRTSGAPLGLLKATDGGPVKIDGLWELIFGNGASGGSQDVLYFSAGIQNETHGLFGSLSTCHGPAISGVSANPNVLWPPNNKLVPVTIDYTVTDDCDPAPVCTLEVTSSEDPGKKSPEAIVTDAHHVNLIAARLGNGEGRDYTVEISCKSKLPLSSSTTVTVTIPHDQGR